MLNKKKEEFSLKLGFNEYISNEDYHNDREYVSSSGIKLMAKNPREFHRIYVLNEESSFGNQSALDFGSYVHSRILEPHLTEEEFSIFDGKSRRGKAYEEFLEANEGKTIITNSQKYEADKLIHNFERATVLMGDADNEKETNVSKFFTGGKAEETLCVVLDGVKVKVRFDYRKEFDSFGSINDIKTTSSRVDTPEKAQEVCAMFGYHVSAALYVDAVHQETGLPHDFYFCFICKADGNTYMYKASEQMLEEGRKTYKEGLAALAKARETGVYYKNIIKEINFVPLK